MILTLSDGEEIEEGEQQCDRFLLLGPRLVAGMWLIVTNDIGSLWRLMRVEMIHGGPGQALRGLTLRDIAPPYRAKRDVEAPLSTGEWYVRHMGAFVKWCVVAPNGELRAREVNTETEARNRMRDFISNARAFAR